MSEIRHIVRSGHWPSLVGAWLRITVSFMVWLLVAAMSLPLVTALHLTEAEIAWLVSLPLLGGALFRMVGGWSADRLGARHTAVVILVVELLVLLWGWVGVSGYGFLLPILFGTMKAFSGSYELGFWVLAGLAVCAWGTVRVALRLNASSPVNLPS